MAYEGKWNEISPSYFYPKNNKCPPPPLPPPIHLNNKQLTQVEDVKLDRKLAWRKHISTKRPQTP